MVIRSNASARGQLDSLQVVISQMMKGISPELSPDMSAFFQFALQRCAVFFVCKQNGTIVRGSSAADQYIHDLKVHFNAQTIVTVIEIEVLRPFCWLLKPEQISLIQKMLGAAIKAATDEGRSSGASSSSAKDFGKAKVGEGSKRKSGTTISSADALAKKAMLLKVFGK